MSVTGICYAQTDYPEVVPPPPSVASLMRFEEVPIDYYTGQPNINIPLGNISLDKNLSYGIGLSYNTQAIRVDERSGWLGTGFAMSTGGTISRTIKGLPDELNHPLKGKGIYFNEYYNFSTLIGDSKQEFLWNSANGKGGNRLDTDQDIYQYSYLGGSGRFIIVKQGNSLTAVITDSDTNEKINLTYNTTTFVITKFEIIDTKGHVYTFEEHNKNKIISVSTSTSQIGSIASANGDYMGTSDVPNAWYLKDIKLPNGEELCHFTYQTVEENYHTPSSSIRYSLINATPLGWGGTTNVQNANASMLMPREIYSSQTINSQQKYVDVVTFRDGTSVKYNLDPSGHPEYGVAQFGYYPGAKLNSIQILNREGIEHKKINFTYEVTNNNHLFLTEVEEVYGTLPEDILTYTLEYNNKTELPSFGDGHQDNFGYYNGPDSDNPYALYSLADPEKATTGAIKSITYPTGGKKEFVFESNSYGYQGDNTNTFDPATIPGNRIGQSMSGSLSIDYGTQVSSGAYLIYMDVGQKMRISSSIDPNGNGSGADQNEHRLRFHKAEPKPGVTITSPSGPVNYSNYNINDFQYDNNGMVREFDLVNNNTMSGLSQGWYFIELTTPQVGFNPESTLININFTVNHSTFQLNTVNMKGGGIRIKDILFTDNGDEKRKISYLYMDNPFITSGINLASPEDFISSGSFEFNPNSRTYTKGKTHPFFTSIDCNVSANPSTTRVPGGELVNYTVARDISAIYTPNTKGNYVGYKYVLRTESGNGSQLFTYDSPREIQITTGAEISSYPFKPQENLDYRRGKLKKKEVFLEKELTEIIPKVLQEEIYDYHDVFSVVEQSLFTFETQNYSCPWTQFYEFFDNYKAGTPDTPSEVCGPSTIDFNVGTCYNINPDVTTTTYNHIKGVLLPKEVIKKQYFYNGNTLSHTVVSTDNMSYNDKNRIKEQTTEIDEAGITITLKQKMFYPYNEPFDEFTPAEHTVFDLMEANNIIEVPVYSESYRNTTLLSKNKTIFNQFTPNNFQPINVEAYKANETEANEINFLSYDELGHLQEANKKDGTSVVYIWGYDKTVPIAKIENATYSQIFNYVANLQALSNDDDDRTEDVRNSNGVVTSYTGKEGALRSALKNLRNALPSAMVTSFTYDPLVGVTSITDPRGETVYYLYDNHHRLEYVKDADQKIVSANKYNYKN